MNFKEFVLEPFLFSVKEYGTRNAFCIKGEYYSYDDLSCKVLSIRQSLNEVKDKAIGLVPNDDIYTYASILAIWMEGKHYVPLHPSWPIDRCQDIISQVEINCILDSSCNTRFEGNVINTANLLPGGGGKYRNSAM